MNKLVQSSLLETGERKQEETEGGKNCKSKPGAEERAAKTLQLRTRKSHAALEGPYLYPLVPKSAMSPTPFTFSDLLLHSFTFSLACLYAHEFPVVFLHIHFSMR